MDPLADDFGKRSEAYERRARALDRALDRLQTINSALNLVTLALVGGSVVWLWDGMTAKRAIIMMVVAFLLRWVVNLALKFGYVDPTLRRIDREAPAPKDFT
jgi:hypothetical protein